MRQFKILNIITGGLISDGITNSWLNFCKEFNKNAITLPFRMDFIFIKCESSEEMKILFNNEGIHTPVFPSRSRNTFRYIKKLYKVLKNEQYDIVHVNGSSSLIILEIFIAWMAGTKVRIAHSRNTRCNHKILHYMLRTPLNWLCNERISCGNDAGKWLFGNRNFEVIHNGKDLSRFSFNIDKRKEIRKRLNIDKNFVIGHVGKFNNQKNHTFLIDVFEKFHRTYPDSILLLIGDGPLFSEIQNIVSGKNLSEKVIFIGAVDNVQDYLQGIDIMVFPSLYEGLPNVVLEWQSMGIPSIISDRITTECIVSNLVKIEKLNSSYDTWVDDIVDIRNSYPERKKASINGKNALRVNNFDITKCSSMLQELYIKYLGCSV